MHHLIFTGAEVNRMAMLVGVGTTLHNTHILLIVFGWWCQKHKKISIHLWSTSLNTNIIILRAPENTPLIDFIIYEKLFSIIYFQSKPMTRSICTTGFKNYPGLSLFIQVSEVWYAIIYCGTSPHIIFLLSLLTISCLPIGYFLTNFGGFRHF